MMAYVLITGTSSGIGAALAERFLSSGNTLFCISRSNNADLIQKAKNIGIPMTYTIADLLIPETASNFMQKSFSAISSPTEPIILINNAGVISPVKPIIGMDEKSMKEHYDINFFTPAILTSCFMQQTAMLKNPTVILNISSGAAYIPYEGWSMYGSSKAALNMFTKIAGMEWKRANSKIFALAPGIVESKLQEQIRNTDETLFPEKETFVKLYSKKQLLKASFVADIVAKTITDDRIETGSFLSLDDLINLLQ